MHLRKKKKVSSRKAEFCFQPTLFLWQAAAQVSRGLKWSPEAWNRIIIPGEKKKISEHFVGRMSTTQINHSLLPHIHFMNLV